jgi:dTDP-glucose pyrophosphorylase
MSDWQKLLISPEASIESAVQSISAGAMRIALVVDAEGRLLGTVTDGDVRRALLQRVALSEPVAQIMNATPKSVPLGTSRQDVVALMQAQSLLQVPIVDAERRVVGIETLLERQRPRLDNWVFLVAGGFGTRLRPLTDTLPKPMLEIGGRPVLEIILEGFIACGFHRFTIAVHYRGETIKRHFGNGERWNVTIRYVEEETPLGTAGALGLLPQTEDLPLIVMNGDLLTRLNFLDLLRYHEAQNATATVCARQHFYQIPYGVVEASGQTVRRIVEKPVQSCLVNAGIYVIDPAVIRAVTPGVPRDMPDLIQELVERNDKVCLFPIHEYWLDIGQVADFERALQDFPGRLEDSVRAADEFPDGRA